MRQCRSASLWERFGPVGRRRLRTTMRALQRTLPPLPWIANTMARLSAAAGRQASYTFSPSTKQLRQYSNGLFLRLIGMMPSPRNSPLRISSAVETFPVRNSNGPVPGCLRSVSLSKPWLWRRGGKRIYRNGVASQCMNDSRLEALRANEHLKCGGRNLKKHVREKRHQTLGATTHLWQNR